MIPITVAADSSVIDVDISNGSNVPVTVAANSTEIPAEVASDGVSVSVDASTDALIPCAVDAVVTILPHLYTGEYEITPSTEEQILHTNGENMAHDVVIHRIPNNYGRITWNGSTLTVS